MCTEWHNNKLELPEVNIAVEVMLNDGKITHDAVQYINYQYVWEKHQGNIKYWRYETRIDYIISMNTKTENSENHYIQKDF